MGILNALRGGGNKDAMRQTTSLTMAYLLEQNARFEVFIRQKVDELEAIVAQQQARQADAIPEVEEAETWQEPEEVEVEPAVESAEVDTRPAKPVTSYFSDFTLDDLAPTPSEAGEVFVSAAEPAGAEATPLADMQPVTGTTPTPEAKPASPPDWQALLLSDPPSAEEAEKFEGSAGESLVSEPVPKEMKEVTPSEVITAGNEAGPDEEAVLSDLEEVEEPAESAQNVINAGEQTRGAGAVAAEAEDDGEWDVALDNQGPAGNWE